MKLSVLLVEQRVGEALGSCDYSYVLEVGRIVLQGPPAEISSNKLLSQAYLGL
jgi:branched-chain amino acid transport system ATP-binding protein